MSKKMQKIVRLLIVSVFILTGCMSDPTSVGKVTDPADPRFDPMKFSYFDYKGTGERQKIFPVLFPVGTDKSFVDKVLVDAGRAKAERITDPKMYININSDWIAYSYFFEGTTAYRELMGWGPVTENIGFYFDRNNKVAQITKGPKVLIQSGE